MKKYIPIIILIPFLFGMILIGGRPNIASCTTANDSEQWTPVDQSGGNAGTVQFNCNKVVLAGGLYVTGYLVRICDNSGGDTGNIEVSLYYHDSGNDQPDETSQVANSDQTVAAGTLPDCNTYTETFVELSLVLTLSSGTYWICNEEQNSADVYVRKDGTSTGDRSSFSDDGGSNWTNQDNQSYDLEIWGCAQ